MILKLRFTTETSQEATFEDLVNFVFETLATALTDAPWTGQVCSEQHVLQYSQPLALFAGGSQIGLGTGLAISVFFFTGLSVLSLFNLTHAVVRHQ